MSFYTVDPYYDTLFYNECKEALRNNGVEFKEFINIKAPYHWYFKLDNAPYIVNYDELPESSARFMVNTVKPLRSVDEYIYMRREADTGKNIIRFIENEPLREARTSDYAVFFTIGSREEGLKLSKDFPGRIWYMGKYYSNKYNVCLSTNSIIKNFLRPEQILLEKDSDEIGRFEAELNFKVFRMNDMLEKISETPYFFNGKYKDVSIRPEISSKFKI